MLRLFAAVLALSAFSVSASFAQPTDCVTFFDKQEFEAFNEEHGKFLKGVESFEESNIPPEGKQPLPAPLNSDPNTVEGIGFPEGLSEKNITIQDNITTEPNPPDPNPSGHPAALFVIGAGFLGSNSKKVGEDLFLFDIPASLDLIFPPEENHTGIGFELSRFREFPIAGWHVTVYDKRDEVIGKFQLPPPPAPEPAKSFFGMWCAQTIGRINIADMAGLAPDAIDDIQMWREVPPIPVGDSTWGRIKAHYTE